MACRGEEVRQVADSAAEKTESAIARAQARLAGARPDGRMTPEEIRAARRDARWRQLPSFADQQRRGAAAAEIPEVPVRFATSTTTKETLQGVNWNAIDQLPVVVPMTTDMEGPSVLKAQVLLDRAGYSPGVIDGQWGKNTAIAVHWIQSEAGMEPTGQIDQQTYRLIASKSQSAPAVTRYSVTADDVDGPFASIPDDVYEQADLDCLCYESAAELLAEKFHTTRETLELLNPQVDLSTVSAGTQLTVPNTATAPRPMSVDKIVVSVEGNYLHALDPSGRIVLHAPTTVGSEYDPSPSEELKIVGIAFDPTFHYQPKLFHEVPDEEPEAMLQPGPNSPVGVVWMALSKENYGIHGTSDPSSIGYASSHGCIRLANWIARPLAEAASQGTVVDFVDER